MSARDDLADLIEALDGGDYAEIADTILAAGWRPPARVITKREQLDALPVEAVIRDAEDEVLERWEDGWEGVGGGYIVILPVTVIHDPSETP
ncbi:hypothetical protein DW322_11190 [Rhodococcus rhodnii]|uniref:Uncharacterized protein n=2 Tax=Rhodococcus rhodnii TaxID=38312 RepID=R7WRV2_9NOCA|nr:hypothetical protein [Rhodococcus rhodnii]EOM78048.1 hypothetical protein Rrhod_0589 [Rhodococcus rhodnii LMG 5362]TXG90676.1 hypothetical protein DW322_11190 [Rhodococcus rhodnii]